MFSGTKSLTFTKKLPESLGSKIKIYLDKHIPEAGWMEELPKKGHYGGPGRPWEASESLSLRPYL